MTIKSAVIGYPIGHSLSPKIHQFFLNKYNIDGSYEKLEIPTPNFNEDIQTLIAKGYKGFNVTIPHKEAIFKQCHYLSKSAFLTKAVNTIVITSDQKLFGHNSDADGFIDNLKYNINNLEFNHKNAFIIGAGGAARAIIYGLIKSGVKNIFITNRSSQRAQNIIADFAQYSKDNNSTISFLDKKEFELRLDECDLLVNSTSLGMESQDELELNINNLKKTSIVYDIVYKPLITKLLQNAQDNGHQIVTGIGMLVFQALIGFELWFGTKPEEEDINELFKTL